jgi:hypothetical protein
MRYRGVNDSNVEQFLRRIWHRYIYYRNEGDLYKAGRVRKKYYEVLARYHEWREEANDRYRNIPDEEGRD